MGRRKRDAGMEAGTPLRGVSKRRKTFVTLKNSRIAARGSERREARRCDEPSLGESQIPAEPPPSTSQARMQRLFFIGGLSKVVKRWMIGAQWRCRGIEERVAIKEGGGDWGSERGFVKLDGQRLHCIDDECMFPAPGCSEKTVLTP
jgi:hypothetical protein